MPNYKANTTQWIVGS